jgi:hypothetical protein
MQGQFNLIDGSGVLKSDITGEALKICFSSYPVAADISFPGGKSVLE